MTKYLIDPPSGWKYGFPKELPENVTDLRQWLINNGYPESQVDFGMKYCSCYRDWETDRKSTRLNSSHSAKSRMPSSA